MALQLNLQPQWHEYRPGVKLHIAPVSRGDMRRITREAAGDEDAAARLFADHVLRGWDGLVDGQGNELPLTAENKMAVMDDISLSVFVNSKIDLLIEAQQKN